nr:geraniol 8-hydroxylase-like [Tanacetum cinerariifolium]
MELMSLAITSIIFFFFFLHGLDLYRKRRMPPGPAGLPIIGNLLDIGANPHESLAKLSKKHGPLMTIRLGSVTTVVASTPDAAREILQRNDVACSGRTIRDAVTSMNNHDSAMIWIQPNQEWRTLRKALNTCLTQKQKLDSLSGLRQNVVGAMLEFLRESGRNNKAVNIGKLTFAVALNQMSNTILSRNVTSYNSDDIGGFKTRVKTVMEVDGKFNIADIFPLLKPLDPQNLRRQAKAAYSWLDTLIEGFICERLKHRESKLPRFGDVLDSLLDYNQDHEADFKLTHVKTLLVDMFLGGTETNSNTTEWVMTELLLNPHIFSRIREEVSATVGKDGKIQEAKILELPFLQAVIKESVRLHLPVPLLVPHKAETEIKLGKIFRFPNGLSLESYDDYFSEYLSGIGIEPFPDTRPLWELHLFKYPTSNASGIAIFKLHHALGDGYSLMGVVLSCLQRADDPSIPLIFPKFRLSPKSDTGIKSLISRVPLVLTAVKNTVLDLTVSVLKSNLLEDDRSPIRSEEERVEFKSIDVTTLTFSLDQIKQIKYSLDVVHTNFLKWNGAEKLARSSLPDIF